MVGQTTVLDGLPLVEDDKILTQRLTKHFVVDRSVVFHAPWCSHCQAFKSVWEDVAIHFHEKPEKKIKIGRIDGDSERALTSRFHVQAYPSLYLINGYSVYKYEGTRAKKDLIDFVEGQYRKRSAIPFFSSPMGPLGLCQGAFLHVAYGTFRTIDWLQNDMGLSPFFALMLLFGGAFVGTFITIVFATIAFTPKEKTN